MGSRTVEMNAAGDIREGDAAIVMSHRDCDELTRYRKLFTNLEDLLARLEPEHIRLNRYAGTICAGIKDASQKGSPIFRFKGASVLEALEQLAAGVE